VSGRGWLVPCGCAAGYGVAFAVAVALREEGILAVAGCAWLAVILGVAWRDGRRQAAAAGRAPAGAARAGKGDSQ